MKSGGFESDTKSFVCKAQLMFILKDSPKPIVNSYYHSNSGYKRKDLALRSMGSEIAKINNLF